MSNGSHFLIGSTPAVCVWLALHDDECTGAAYWHAEHNASISNRVMNAFGLPRSKTSTLFTLLTQRSGCFFSLNESQVSTDVCACGFCEHTIGRAGTQTHLLYVQRRPGAPLAPGCSRGWARYQKLLSGPGLAGGWAAALFLRARQIATNHWHQRLAHSSAHCRHTEH